MNPRRLWMRIAGMYALSMLPRPAHGNGARSGLKVTRKAVSRKKPAGYPPRESLTGAPAAHGFHRKAARIAAATGLPWGPVGSGPRPRRVAAKSPGIQINARPPGPGERETIKPAL